MHAEGHYRYGSSTYGCHRLPIQLLKVDEVSSVGETIKTTLMCHRH